MDPTAKPATGATQVVKVGNIKRIARGCGSPASVAGAGAGAAAAGMAIGTKVAVVAGVSAAALVGGMAAAGVFEEEQATVSR